jgi:hypothetical protein
MTDYRDPNDPLDPVNPRSAGYRDLDEARGMNWGWIAGGLVALFLVFAFVFGFSGGDRTASNNTTNTGQTTTSTNPPPTASRPATQENTGAAPRTTPAPATGTQQ